MADFPTLSASPLEERVSALSFAMPLMDVVKEHNVVMRVVTIHIAYQAVYNVQVQIILNVHQFLVATHLALDLNSVAIQDVLGVPSAAKNVLKSDALREWCVVTQLVLWENRVATLIVRVPLLTVAKNVLPSCAFHNDGCVVTQLVLREKYVATLTVRVALLTVEMFVPILNALMLQIHNNRVLPVPYQFT